MSLAEDILDFLPDNVYDITVKRADIHGMDMIKVVVLYRDPADKAWFLDINFATKNKMTAEEMAANINSRLRFETSEV